MIFIFWLSIKILILIILYIKNWKIKCVCNCIVINLIMMYKNIVRNIFLNNFKIMIRKFYLNIFMYIMKKKIRFNLKLCYNKIISIGENMYL